MRVDTKQNMDHRAAIFEAFVPSSSELPDHPIGLFTGEPDDIRQWACLTSGARCFPNQVRVRRRDVYHVDRGKLADRQAEDKQAELLADTKATETEETEVDATGVMMMYEAFIPQRGKADLSVGLFIGGKESIRTYVAAVHCRHRGQVHVRERQAVQYMDKEKLDAWVAAKDEAVKGKQKSAEAPVED